MNGFLYGIAVQWKMDIRSKSLRRCESFSVNT